MNLRMLKQCCVNWKVVVALAAIGVGVWLLAPRLILSVLPLLILAACPLSMVVMMIGMRRMRQSPTQAASEALSTTAFDDVERWRQDWRQAPLGTESASLVTAHTRTERLAGLHCQLARLHAEQETLRGELALLESTAHLNGAANSLDHAARPLTPARDSGEVYARS